jgi:phosphatidylserine/phosphatidylglycerophosphate/cardiolipin synthase-like enzyme
MIFKYNVLIVMVLLYLFLPPIVKAFFETRKKRNGLKSSLDKSKRAEKYSSADFLFRAGVTTLIDSAYAFAHNKVRVTDEEIVITGSLNFTSVAQGSRLKERQKFAYHPG